MDNEKSDKLLDLDTFRTSDWAKAGSRSWARRKVFAEFSHWVSELRDSRLAERAGRLWQILQDGGLTRTDVAAVVGTLLYCISPFDLLPDAIPALGYVDDLLVVVTVLTYLEKKSRA